MRTSILVACLWLAASPLWGKIVFYAKRDGIADIYTMKSDGTHLRRLTFGPKSNFYPAWSPNGQQIAFSSTRDDIDDKHKVEENVEIYVMDADGRNQRRLTNSPGIDTQPDWHPDGNQIAFTSSRNANEKKDMNIFVMDTDGSNVRQITNLEFATRPKWSPDGQMIASEGFTEGRDREVFVVSLDGNIIFKVSEPRADAGILLAGWSPNGKQILYDESIDFRKDKSTLVIATLAPAGQRRVSKRERLQLPQMPLGTTSFSADGKSIILPGKRNNQWDIYRFNLRDDSLTQVTDSRLEERRPREWNPRLAVRPQRLLPLFWGRIKSELLSP